MDLLHARIISVLKQIPKGKVASYGQIGALAGNPRSARQVVWVLHTHAERLKLPWFRVINSAGKISLPKGSGFEQQRALLLKEKVQVTTTGRISMSRFQWQPKLRKRR